MKLLQIYPDKAECLLMLDDDLAGQLVKAMIRYQEDHVEPELNGMIRPFWCIYRQMIDSNLEMYAKRSASGRVGGLRSGVSRAKAAKAAEKDHPEPETPPRSEEAPTGDEISGEPVSGSPVPCETPHAVTPSAVECSCSSLGAGPVFPEEPPSTAEISFRGLDAGPVFPEESSSGDIRSGLESSGRAAVRGSPSTGYSSDGSSPVSAFSDAQALYSVFSTNEPNQSKQEANRNNREANGSAREATAKLKQERNKTRKEQRIPLSQTPPPDTPLSAGEGLLTEEREEKRPGLLRPGSDLPEKCLRAYGFSGPLLDQILKSGLVQTEDQAMACSHLAEKYGTDTLSLAFCKARENEARSFTYVVRCCGDGMSLSRRMSRTLPEQAYHQREITEEISTADALMADWLRDHPEDAG